ncbi:hypothetical protein [Tannerella forsythia]|uniref:Uncharacterized protein n=1 Tax=Tannerella forsythia TaxID=28112 RepID=A0A3P1YX18_TANFO|nr:hypothetical protein [Tannerella forsythia]RRD75238.1 hypothetical protein EII41_06920 [Tannerella forsythia]
MMLELKNVKRYVALSDTHLQVFMDGEDFFIKSPWVKLFRICVKKLVLRVEGRRCVGTVPVPAHIAAMPVPGRETRANRLTPNRMIHLLTLAHQIKDEKLRLELVRELTEGGAQ